VGQSQTATGYNQGFVYINGQLISLGTLPGGSYSSAASINNTGWIAGYSSNSSALDRAVMQYWLGGQIQPNRVMTASVGPMIDLGTLGGDNSFATGINDLNQVVGSSQNAAGQLRAFFYTGTPGAGGVMHDLGTLGGTTSFGCGINNLSHIVGYARTAAGQTHAFLYTGVPGVDGVMHDLGTLGGTNSWAMGINDRSQVVGYSHTAGGQTHAFLYTGTPGLDGVLRDLGTFPGGTDSWARSINNLGQIVGKASTPDGFNHAFLCNPFWNPAALSQLLLD
jgi:probable HAF family extracellular repeat protein